MIRSTYERRKAPRTSVSTSATAAASRWVCLRATIAEWERLGHARDVESSRNRQHPLLGPQYGIAVEIGHHEPADAVKHLAHVEVAVALDDRGVREHSESAQDRLDLAAPSTCNRNACGIWQRTNDFQSLERGITPAGCVMCRGDSGRAG